MDPFVQLGKAVMLGGREAGCSRQLLQSCAAEPSAAAATRFASTSAASGQNLRGTTPHLPAPALLIRLLPPVGTTQALGSRPARPQVRPGVGFQLCLSIFQQIVCDPPGISASFCLSYLLLRH